MDIKKYEKIEGKKNLKKWVMFPDALPTQRYRGYEVREDETQNQGAFVVGQNMTFANARIPTIRQGYEVIDAEATDATPIKSAWIFENRAGVQFELKSYSTFVDYMIIGVTTTWKHLLTGLTSGLEMGHANIGKSGDATSHTIFGNGTDSNYKFSGAYGTYLSDNASNTITLAGSTTLANLGFTATGSITINSDIITYTGLSAQTFTGCSAVPTTPTVGDVVIQVPIAVTGLASLLSSVLMAHDGRLHARLDTKKSIWNYSKLDDPFDFTTGASDADGGSKEVEFGGSIVAFGKLNKTALCFKKNIIKLLDFNQVGARLDSPVYKTLVSVDDKGTSLGATNQKSTFSTPLGQVFVTPDKRMVLLTGVTANNEPQYLFLSDPIQPAFTNGVHDTAVGICVDNVIYYAFKQNTDSTYNDTVLRGDLTRQTVTSDGKIIPIMWDTPYIGWNVSDFTVIYNSTLKRNEIHWHSAINSSTYKIIDSKSDATSPFTSTIRTWSENFGKAYLQKKIDYAYIEIKMSENTEVTATLLYDEDGVTGREEYVLKAASDTAYKFDSTIYNPFGASEFGSQKIGSNPLSSALKKYRYFIETPNNLYFFNLSLQLSTSSDGADIQLIRHGFRLTEILEESDRVYKKGAN